MDFSRDDLSRRSLLKQGAAVGTAALFSGVMESKPGREPGPKENELLVGIEGTADIDAVRAKLEREIPSGASIVHRNETLGYVVVELPDVTTASEQEATQTQLEAHSDVGYVEENGTVEALRQPADVEPPADPKFDDQYAPQLVNAPEAWEQLDGDQDVTVAVLDTGVQYDHPDLEAQFESDKGQDFVDGDDDPYPSQRIDGLISARHGTHVAGIVAANRGNETGIAGISDATLLSGRVLDKGGSGSLSDVADGIQWAADRSVPIINLSLGHSEGAETLRKAVSYAVEQGSLPIAAAGNSEKRNVQYPAAYEEVVAVAGINENENPYDSSFGGTNYGPEIDVAAPAQRVLSTIPPTIEGFRYSALNGTSMAAPVVSGVAALGVATANGQASPAELRRSLEQTAVDIGLSAEKQGAGRVDAANMVQAMYKSGTFADVSEGHWAFYQIESLSENGVVSGYSDGTFKPEQSITRGEFASLLTKAFDLADGDHSFTDIEDHWARDAIVAAADAGFLSGYQDETFRPDQQITRQELIVSLSTGLEGAPEIDVERWLESFADTSSIADWAREPIARANRATLLENDQFISEDSSDVQSDTGSSGTIGSLWAMLGLGDQSLFAANAAGLRPEKPATRAAAANFLWNRMTVEADEESPVKS